MICQPQRCPHDHPDAELLHPLPDDNHRPAYRHQGSEHTENHQPEVVTGEAQVFFAERARRLGHDDNLERRPADELDNVEPRGKIGTAHAEGRAEADHCRHTHLAARDARECEQHSPQRGP